MSFRLGAMILAAGESSRFGENKLLASHPRGGALIEYVLAQVVPLSSSPVVVVTGKYQQALSQALKNMTDISLVYNENWQDGMGGSIAKGMTELKHHALTHVLICLGDLGQVSTASLLPLVQAAQSLPQSRIASSIEGRGMAPAVFPVGDFDALLDLSGTQGASHLLQGPPPQCIKIPHPEAAMDVDEPADLERLSLFRCN